MLVSRGCRLLAVLAVSRASLALPAGLGEEVGQYAKFLHQSTYFVKFNPHRNLQCDYFEHQYDKCTQAFLSGGPLDGCDDRADQAKRPINQWSNLPKEERAKIAATLLPPTFQGFKAFAKKHFNYRELPLLFAVFAQESSMKPLSEEGHDKPNMIRSGVGLVQMSAWKQINAAGAFVPVEHDYMKYNKWAGAETELLPAKVNLASQKAQIKSYQDFKESPFNPAVALWFGYRDIVLGCAAQMKQMAHNKDLAFSSDNDDRNALLGLCYNGGHHRIRCAYERLRILYAEAPGAPRVASTRDIVSMLYLEESSLKESGLKPNASLVRNFTKLKSVCRDQGVSDPMDCSCLDTEPKAANTRDTTANRSGGNDYKAAIMRQYAGSIPSYLNCFRGL